MSRTAHTDTVGLSPGLRVATGLAAAILISTPFASATQPRSGAQESELAAAAAPARSPEELMEDFLGTVPSANRFATGFPYFYIPPAGTDAPAGGSEGAPAAARTAVDPEITFKAYEAAGSDGKSPRQVFDEIMTDVVAAGASSGKHGAEGARELYSGPAGDRLIAAAVQVLDAHGDKSPKAIKQLIKTGRVSREHAALMWIARDILVRRTLDGLKATLAERHPGVRFDITILDSGSYGSIGSDIDKTLHLAAWDAQGNELKTFGPGGQILGGDIAAFLQIAVDQFDAQGRRFGASDALTKSMDAEFFSTDTLPGRFARGTTHASGESALGAAAGRRRENFAALQRNPGPAYQFEAKVVAQVVGRTVEQDVAVQQERRRLARQRDELDDFSGDAGRSLFLQEMLTSAHSPAVVFGHDDPNPRAIDVVEFLERNNLAVRYTAAQAVENALGDYEKLMHKWEAVVRPDGSFDLAAYDALVNDIVKYGDRAPKDLATALFADTGDDKPAAFAQFGRRFGPEDSARRFGPEGAAANMREYTREVHDSLYGPILQLVHGDGAGSEQKIKADLDLYWATIRTNELLLAIKANPALGREQSAEFVYADLIDFLRTHSPGALEDFDKLGTTDPGEARIRAAKQLHMQANVDSAVRLVAGRLQAGMDMWLRDPRPQAAELLASERAKLGNLKLKRGRLLARVTEPGSSENAARRQELDDLDRRIESVAALVRDVEADPSTTFANIQSAGLETTRRLVVLFKNSGDPNYERMIALLEPAHRRDLELMIRVWEVQATEAEQRRLARNHGIDLTRLAAWGRAGARRLGYAYAESFGVDTAAYFRGETGVRSGDANDPAYVLGRFFRNSYMNIGVADSAMNMIRLMQITRDMPYEQRIAMFSEGLIGEMVGPVPALGPLYATWKGYQAGDSKAIAGGVVNGAVEIAQQWLGVAVADLDTAMRAAGQAGRVETLTRIGRLGGTAALFLSLARTTVEILGNEAFEPVRDQYFQLAYKGFVDPQQRGLIRAGSTETSNTLPVTPIIEPRGVNWARFLYLKPGLAQQYLVELRDAGDNAAAVALLRLAGLDENLDTGFDTDGTCGPASPGACAVTIDLDTDFGSLIAGAGADNLPADLSPSLRDRAYQARARVVAMWRGHAELQRATRARIAADRARRQNVDGRLNLWLLAARENLGFALDDEFRQQAQLLYQRLIGLPDVAATFAAESDAAWQQWKTMAPSHEDEARIRQQFLQIMSPRLAYEQRVAAIRQQADAVGAVSWTSPAVAVGDLIARSVRERMQWLTVEDRQRDARIDAFERQTASLGAFANNSYANRAEATPTEPYNLEGAAEWYGAEIAGWRRFLAEVHSKEPPAGRGLVDLLLDAEQQIARLEKEFGLVMQGFGEVDAIVAPKIAQLLLLDWMRGGAPFDNDLHTALTFLWYDTDTQGRIRQRVVRDMVRGRRLIPLFRSQAAAHRNLLAAELNDIRVEHSRAVEDAIRQRFREALRVADALADLRRGAATFDGALELEVDPYLVADADGVRVVIDTKAHHEMYRAMDVVVETGAKMVPYDAIENVVGRARYDDALAQAGIAEDEVLFAVVVDARVKSARPPPGHDAKAYDDLPASAGHLLLIPGRPKAENLPALAPAPASEPADVAMKVCVLEDAAPDDIPPASVLDYCDPSVAEPGEYDRIAIFFTPARDLREPLAERESFLWRVVSPNGNRVLGSEGVFDPGSPELSFTAEGAPGRFVQVVNLWDRGDDIDPAQARSGPGLYKVQTVTAGPGTTGLFGMGESSATIAADAEWQDEIEFEVASSRLYFQGFITEQVRELPLPRRGSVWEGALTLGEPTVDGSHVVLEAEAWWRDAQADNRGENGAAEQLGRASTRLDIQFPEEIAPGHTEMAEIRSSVEPLGERERLFFTAGMHLLIPTMKPPDRFLVAGAIPAPWAAGGALPSTYCMIGGGLGGFSEDRFRVEETVPNTASGLWIMPRESIAEDCLNYTLLAPRQQTDRTILVAGRPERLAGDPGRSMTAWLHEKDAFWAIPVFVTLTSTEHAITPPEAVRTYGYAVYAARPGRYEGPLPTGLPDSGNVADAADDAADEEADNGADNDAPATGTGTGTGTGAGDDDDSPAGAGGSGNAGGGDDEADGSGGTGGEGEPAGSGGDGGGAIDPSAPDISALISQWLAVAEPPQNATEGAHLRYNHRGTWVGTLRGGIITAAHDEGTSFDPGYVWNEKRSLDSVDHCTLEEYVLARLAEASIAHCLGRYVATPRTSTPDVAGQKVAAATALLEGSGFSVAPKIVAEPESESLAFTVVTQRPAAGADIEPRALIELDIYGAFVTAATAVPDVTGLPAAEARARLEAAGFGVEISIGGAPASASEAYRVFAQTPSPGTLVAAGTNATLRIYSDHQAVVPVPSVADMSVAEAEAVISEAGLVARLTDIGVSPSAGRAHRVADTSPGSGVEVALGTEVEIRVYGDFVDPRCAALLRDGKAEALVGNAISALPLLREARALACEAPWLAATLADLEQAAAAFDRCETLVANGNARRQAGDLQGTLGFYRQARDAGCANFGLTEAVTELENTLSQQERNRRCTALIEQGNAARAASDLAGALAAYRQARDEGCGDPGLAGAITELEQQIAALNNRDNECRRRIDEGYALGQAGRYEEALIAYRFALIDGCTSTPPLPDLMAQLENAIANEGRRSEQEEQWRRDDEARQSVQCAGSYRQIEDARRRGNDGLVLTLTLAAVLTGCDMAGVDTGPLDGGGGGRPGGPPVDVGRASTTDFVGEYALTDPSRTYAEYHGTVVIRGDGSFLASEWTDGVPRADKPAPGVWQFDSSTRVFDFDWRPGGRFTGPVAGTTYDFVIDGRWSNGSSGRLRIVRQ